ncbi:MAG TPA: hypothetical protein VLH75_18180 [Longimicrobiales bacterium]|nr:hypothetical protein [Longimicrobiales bacterium]
MAVFNSWVRGGDGSMEMAPVRGRPLGPLGWLITLLLEAAVRDMAESEPERQERLLRARGQESLRRAEEGLIDDPIMERKVA